MFNRNKLSEALAAACHEIQHLKTLISTIKKNTFGNPKLDLPHEQKKYLRNLVDQTTELRRKLRSSYMLLKKRLLPFNKEELSNQDIIDLIAIENDTLLWRGNF